MFTQTPPITMLRQGVLLCALALLAVAHARMPRDTEKEREMFQKVGDSLRDTKQATSHEFFVLVQPEAGQKNSMEKTEELAKDFKKRLGEDKHVKVSPISKVANSVMKDRGCWRCL